MRRPAAAPRAGPASASPVAPIPLVAADEDFELERPYESPTTSMAAERQPRRAPAPPPRPRRRGRGAEDRSSSSRRPRGALHRLGAVDPAPARRGRSRRRSGQPAAAGRGDAPAPARAAGGDAAAAVRRRRAPAAGPSTLTSPTLGELYFNQGFTDKAIEVYRELIAREPGNERLAARLRELEKLQRALGGGEPAAAPAPRPKPPAPAPTAADSAAADRRQAIERTIVRLEGLLSAIRKG